MSATPAQQSVHFVTLDRMRGLAALAVVGLHVCAAFAVKDDPLHNAALAVDFFFCLSGFVVAHAYDRKVASMGLVHFMGKRAQRLGPMILFGAAVGAISSTIAGQAHVAPLAVAAAFLFPVSLVTGGALAFPLNFPVWSLFFEMAASAGYGLERGRIGARWLALALVPMALVLVGVLALKHGVATMGVGARISFLTGFIRVAYPFALGMFLARSKIYLKTPRLPSWVVCLLLVAMLVCPVQSWAYDAVAVIVLAPLLVMLGAAVDDRSRAQSFLGRLSYPLYLVHVPAILLARTLMIGTPVWISAGAAAVGAIVLGVLATLLFDEPVRAWLATRRGVWLQRRVVPQSP